MEYMEIQWAASHFRMHWIWSQINIMFSSIIVLILQIIQDVILWFVYLEAIILIPWLCAESVSL